jgi:hypothetical protein
VDERLATRAALRRRDLAHEERVIAQLVLGGQAALDPAERSREQWRTKLAALGLDPGPVRDRRDAAREVLCEVLLLGGEDADRERARLSKQLVQGGMPAESDAEEQRLERERDERVDGQACGLARKLDGDDPDRRGNLSQKGAQVGVSHGAILMIELCIYVQKVVKAGSGAIGASSETTGRED